MTAVTVTHRPAWTSAALALVLGLFALSLLPRTGTVNHVLLTQGGGLLLLLVGFLLRNRGIAGRIAGSILSIAGVGLVLLALGLLVAGTARHSVLVETAPGLVGLLLLAFGVLPLRGTGSRGLVTVGTALLFVSVLAAGLFRAPVGTLLVAGALTVVAWDVGENAISIGEHLGIAAETRPIEATHAAGSLLVAGATVGVGFLLVGVGTAGLSLVQLALLLVAILALSVALHG